MPDDLVPEMTLEEELQETIKQIVYLQLEVPQEQ